MQKTMALHISAKIKNVNQFTSQINVLHFTQRQEGPLAPTQSYLRPNLSPSKGSREGKFDCWKWTHILLIAGYLEQKKFSKKDLSTSLVPEAVKGTILQIVCKRNCYFLPEPGQIGVGTKSESSRGPHTSISNQQIAVSLKQGILTTKM